MQRDEDEEKRETCIYIEHFTIETLQLATKKERNCIYTI